MEQGDLVRYRLGGNVAYGLVRDGVVYKVAAEPWSGQAWTQEKVSAGAAVGLVGEVELLAPCQPTKVVAIGLNYRAHAAEHGLELPQEPLFFLKPAGAIIGPGAAIVYPDHLSQWVDHEAELAVVIGRRAQRVSQAEAMAFVLGYTCANDVTARDLQRRDGQWTRSKSFDTFCPMGPWIVLHPDRSDPGLDRVDLRIRCWVNGQLRQDGRTADMIFSVAELIAHVSAVMTLEPGDVILTGTPAGVGPLVPGDQVAVEIEGIGTLKNSVL
jgi:2-keto-4-pentenoate hydratase/2-oxohepta-3-ene-1,7-dioic acid hydratase in catechol pathway